MTRLLLVELTRLRWRRAILALVAAAVLIPAVIAVTLVIDTRPLPPAEQADLVAQAEAEAAQPYVEDELESCVTTPGEYGVDEELDAAALQAECESFIVPQPEWFGGRTTLDIADQLDDAGSGLAVAAVLGALMLLMGATFVGHDWNTGSMSNQLLFEPRRGRVYLAKALAVGAVAALVSLLVMAAYWAGLAAVMASRDLPHGDGTAVDALQLTLRTSALVAAAALGGFALTMLLRSTVATLGILFAVSVAGGLLVAALGATAASYNPAATVQAIVEDGADFYVPVPDSCYAPRPPSGGVCDDTRTLTAWRATGNAGALLLVVLVPSVLSYRRRDVP